MLIVPPDGWRNRPEINDRRELMATRCDSKTEVYSRVCGFFRPVQQWNRGKKEEFKDRSEYIVAPTELKR